MLSRRHPVPRLVNAIDDNRNGTGIRRGFDCQHSRHISSATIVTPCSFCFTMLLSRQGLIITQPSLNKHYSHAKNRQPPPMPSANDVTALILAGGAGRRVGHRDKGLIPWRGKPLVAHVYDILRPQVDEILISCNRNFSHYARFSARMVADTRRDFQGPLAGIEAATRFVTSDLLVVVACDTPQLPADLVTRLIAPLLLPEDEAPLISYADDGTRAQYLCAAMRCACLGSLPAFLDGGGRAVKDWYSSSVAVAVDFSDQHSCFRNYNSPL